MLAKLLQRLDLSTRPVDAAQYRGVAQRLAREIEQSDADEVQALLAASPCAAELYENMHYAHAGLCRSALEPALAAELAARAAIAAAQRRARPAGTTSE